MKHFFILTALSLSISNVFSQDMSIPPEKPSLVVGIIISEMRYDYLIRFRENFSENGFNKLLSTGTVFKNAHHDYLITESGPGYATLSTGAYPDVHGIVANFWYERLRNNVNFCIRDEKVNSVGGAYESGKFSPSNLLTHTVSDQFKISGNFGSKIISVSLDPTAAVLLGGHTADAAYWYDDTNGRWITSSFYCDSLPEWVEDLNDKDMAGTYLSRKWELLLPPEKYSTKLRNVPNNEQGFSEKSTFPYDLSKLSAQKRKYRDYSLLKKTPFGNTFTKDIAISAIIHEELGKGTHTDWLMMSFSAGSYLGQHYSSWSDEMEDTYLRLDQDIAHFLSFLEEYTGLKNVLIYLTAANAIAHEPSFMLENRLPSGYFNYNSALSLLRTYLNLVYGTGDWVKYYYSQQIYLNRELIEDSRLSLDEFQSRVARFMVQFEGVSNALSSENLMKNNYTHGVFEKIQRNFNQKRSGDIFLGLTPGWVEKGSGKPETSSFRYDTHVPLIFYGWKTGRAAISRNVSVTGIVPTLSALLEISQPQGARGEVLQEFP